MKIVSYEVRVGKMKTPSDVAEQIRLAKQYAKNLRRKKQYRTPNFEDKIIISQAITEAEAVLRKLRLNSFALQDDLAKRIMLLLSADQGYKP